MVLAKDKVIHCRVAEFVLVDGCQLEEAFVDQKKQEALQRQEEEKRRERERLDEMRRREQDRILEVWTLVHTCSVVLKFFLAFSVALSGKK